MRAFTSGTSGTSSTARARSTVSGAILGAVLGVGCGPAPYSIGPASPEEAAVAEAGQAPPASPPAVYVLVGPGQPGAAPAPVIRPAPAREPEDRWIPDGFPRPNPFSETRTWVGAYDCAQGRTNLTFRIIDVRGKLVRAVFDFHHAPSNAAGQYIVGGAYDEQSGVVAFEPGPWIIHPDGYVPVGLRGRVSRDGARFAGRITDPRCGGFQLRAAR